jgi:hypothetical protein
MSATDMAGTHVMAHRWFFPLAGNAPDLEDICRQLQTGDLRIEDRKGKACLCGDRFDALDNATSAYKTVKAFLPTFNDVFAAVSNSSFEPVQLESPYFEVRPDGVELQHHWLQISPGKFHIRGGDITLPDCPSDAFATAASLAESWVAGLGIVLYPGVAVDGGGTGKSTGIPG